MGKGNRQRVLRSKYDQGKKAKIFTVDGAVYQNARDEKKFVVGEEDDDGTDWSHFDFMLSILVMPKMKHSTHLQVLKIFWEQLYPFIGSLIKEERRIDALWKDSCEQQDLLLKKNAQYQEKIKFYEQYLKDMNQGESYVCWENAFRRKIQKKSDQGTEENS